MTDETIGCNKLAKLDDTTPKEDSEDSLSMTTDDYPSKEESVEFLRKSIYTDPVLFGEDVQLFEDPVTGATIEQAYVLPTAIRNRRINMQCSKQHRSTSQMKTWPSRLNVRLLGFITRRKTRRHA